MPKLDHIKIKPTVIKFKDLNADKPTNGELFAEYMEDLQETVKAGVESVEVAAWGQDPAECYADYIRYLKTSIRKLLA